MSEENAAEARVWISFVNDIYHVRAETTGCDKEAAEKLAQDIMRFLTHGRRTFVRIEPTARSDNEYNTGITHHQGYVRFAFKDEAGGRETLEEAPIDDVGYLRMGRMSEVTTDDAKTFGVGVWVYCRQHLRPHTTGWCTVHVDQKERLEATTMEDAYAECRRRTFTIYSDK